jgi:hypothetical protein
MAIATFGSDAIIPAPLMTISRQISRNESGKIQRAHYDIVLKGKTVADKGSPNAAGTFYTGAGYPPDDILTGEQKFGALLRKIEALKNMFCNTHEGQWFIIQPQDGSQPLKFQPRVKSIDFSDTNSRTQWVETADYTVTMEADSVTIGGAEITILGEADEQWTVEAVDEKLRAYKLSHIVSSQQKDLFDATGNVPDGNKGWQRAKALVIAQLGIDFTQAWAQDVLNLNGWSAYNYTRQQQVDEAQGRYQVSESWVLYDTNSGATPPAFDDFSVSTRKGQDGLTQVTVEGTVQGLEIRNNSTYELVKSKYESAEEYYDTIASDLVFSRATTLSSVDNLNPVVLNSQIHRDENNGRISYTIEYNNRRAPITDGAAEELIQMTDSGGEDLYAEIAVIGRPQGPVLQYLFTKKKKVRTVNIELTMPATQYGFLPSFNAPNTDGIVTALRPNGIIILIDDNNITWSPDRGKYTRTTRFVYQ